MSKVRYFRSYNIDTVDIDGDDIVSANGSLIRQNDGVDRVDYRGSFNVSGSAENLQVSGTLREIDYFRFGRQVLEVTDINRDAGRVATLVGNENSSGFLSFILSGNDQATLSAGADRFRGFNGADRVSGNGGNDTVFGGSGNDTIFGGGGRDRLIGNGGNDRLIGGGGADVEIGGGGRDRLSGGAANDRLSGGAGNDTVVGGGGRDTVLGGGGSDTLQGGGGSDLLTGGGGPDTFRFTRNDATDTIRDFRQGSDQIEILSGASRFRQLDIDNVGSDVQITFANTTIIVEDARAGQFDASDFIF